MQYPTIYAHTSEYHKRISLFGSQEQKANNWFGIIENRGEGNEREELFLLTLVYSYKYSPHFLPIPFIFLLPNRL